MARPVPYARCPTCDELVEVERTHNGVAWVWHMVHCGWGHAYFADEDIEWKQETK